MSKEKCTLDYKIRMRVISALRKISSQSEANQEVRKRTKVAPSLHQCEACVKLVYVGKSEKNFKKYLEEYSDRVVEMGKIAVDHTDPVLAVDIGYINILEYCKRLFVSADKLSGLCKECHDFKTKEENKQRREYKKD